MGEIGGRQGVFPDNFVKLFEVEKEVTSSHLLTCFKRRKDRKAFPVDKESAALCLQRPKKPPPPSAPSAKPTPGTVQSSPSHLHVPDTTEHTNTVNPHL